MKKAKIEMVIESLMSLINDNEIDKAIKFIENTSSDEFDFVIAYLLKKILSTDNANERNTIAYLLGEIKCQEAKDILMELIFNKEFENNRGNFISALGKLECDTYICQLLPLLYEGNYEVVLNTHMLLQDNVPKMNIVEQKRCVDFIGEKIDYYENILSTLYDVYENIFDGKLDS